MTQEGKGGKDEDGFPSPISRTFQGWTLVLPPYRVGLQRSLCVFLVVTFSLLCHVRDMKRTPCEEPDGTLEVEPRKQTPHLDGGL